MSFQNYEQFREKLSKYLDSSLGQETSTEVKKLVLDTYLDKLSDEYKKCLIFLPYTEKYCFHEDGGYSSMILHAIFTFLNEVRFQTSLKTDIETISITILFIIFHNVGKFNIFENGSYSREKFDIANIEQWNLLIWGYLCGSVFKDIPYNNEITTMICHQDVNNYNISLANKLANSCINLVTKLG